MSVAKQGMLGLIFIFQMTLAWASPYPTTFASWVQRLEQAPKNAKARLEVLKGIAAESQKITQGWENTPDPSLDLEVLRTGLAVDEVLRQWVANPRACKGLSGWVRTELGPDLPGLNEALKLVAAYCAGL